VIHVADVARATVRLTVQVEVQVIAEQATEVEMARFAERHLEEIAEATARRLEGDFTSGYYGVPRGVPSAGWLDEDREVFLEGCVAAEPVGRPMTVAGR
jgi:hypothetical protein